MDFSNIDEGHDDEDKTLHFYYNRDKQIANAPQIVRDYYSGKFRPSGGLFKSLVSTTGNKLLLVCVVLCSAAVVVLHYTGDRPYKKHVGGAVITLKAFTYGDDVYVTLTADSTGVKGNKEAQIAHCDALVEAEFTAQDAQGEVVAQARMGDTMQGGSALLKWKFVNYDAAKVTAVVTKGSDTKTLWVELGRQ